MTRRHALTLLIIALIAWTPTMPHSVRAATGQVYINPMTTPVGPIGSVFTIEVQVANVDPFNAWDIQVWSDPSVISPTSLSITGNVLAANYSQSVSELYNCVNGQGQSCSGTNGGPGIVRSASFAIGGSPPQAGPIDGLLFNITYTVVGTDTYTPIQIQNAIVSYGSTSLPTTTQDGDYGVAPTQNFALTASQQSVSILGGTNASVTLRLSSKGGFTGIVNLTSVAYPGGLSLTLNVTKIQLSSTYPSNVALTIATSSTTPSTGYSVTVTARSGKLFHSVPLAVHITGMPDFILGVSPSLLKIHATDSGLSFLTLDTQSGFSGSIHLKMDVPPVRGLIAYLGQTDLTISPGVPATTVLSVRTPPSSIPFRYLINITASSQSSTHDPFTITVRSPSPDFTLQVETSAFVIQAGQSKTYTVNATSVDYFKGQIFLLPSSLSGMKETLTRPSVALEYGNSSTTQITITTDQFLSPGSHYLNLTAHGTTFLGASVNHTITERITVVPPPVTILGLQPVAYFGIIGVLWTGLLGVAVREIRKPKPKRFLS